MEYKKYRIGNLCLKVSSGGTPKSTQAEYYEDGTIPWLNTKEINFNRIYDTEKKITQLGLDNSAAKLIEPNRVIVAMYGVTAAKVAINKIELSTNQACCNLKINPDKANYEYVYYCLLNEYEHLASLANGGAQQNLNSQTIKDFEISVPDLETQQKIVRILSTLDQKIELNSQQNQTLENLAARLIRNYNEKEGDTITLKAIMSFENGFAFKSKDYQESGKYKVITIKNVQDGLIDSSSSQFMDSLPKDIKEYHKLSVGDVLLSLTGNVGRVGIVFENNLLLNQRVAKIKPKDMRLLPFLYFVFRQKDFKQKLEALAKGTAQLNLSPVETLEQKINYSDRPVVELSKSLTLLFKKIILNNQNSKELVNMRDSLLPKLMSGEINIDEVTI